MNSRVLMVYREADRVLAYRDAAVAAGLDPVLMHVGDPVTLEGFDGLLLTGGTDVNPLLYGEPAQPETEEPDAERDAVEMALTGEALDRDLPLLAICRGLQLLNVWHGGTLVQHLPTVARHRQPDGDRAAAVHQVEIKTGSLLSAAIASEACGVNSRHHQAVKAVGAGLIVSAIDPVDRVVEALERPDKTFVLAVQWHPENQVDRYPEQLRLFEHFGRSMARS